MTRREPARRASVRCIVCLLALSACDAATAEPTPTPSPASTGVLVRAGSGRERARRADGRTRGGRADFGTAPAPVAAPTPDPEPVSEWPEGFPQIPGGTALPASRDGVVHVARAGWSSSPSALESLLRAELERAGWDASPTTSDEDILRFAARREDREIAVSIYADEGRTIMQTMELPRP